MTTFLSMIRLNILHRTDPGERYSIFLRQQDLAHSLGLRTTVFLHYFDLFDERIVKDALGYEATHGDEIGLALHRLQGPEGLSELSGGLDMIWLFEEGRKREILEKTLGRFREVFGRFPVSVSAYHFDSSALRILKEIAPEVEAVVGGCFEEGVRVFHGCNHSWYLFNEGMPWGPWCPSRTHSLRPAANEADWSGVVAVPHLVRDMSLAYEGRNDFWASHPPNIIRGMGNDASFCPYDLNLIDQYRMQADFNGHAYYNTFVSTQWLTWNHNSEYPPEVAWDLYTKQLTYLAGLKKSGELEDLTLAEYARWHRSHRALGEPEVYLAKEMLYASGKHYAWYLDAELRVLVDANQGGSIGDIRAYVAELPGATGPDTPSRENGAYPYLVQSQYRTGYPHHCEDGSRTTLLLHKGNESIDLCTLPTKVANFERRADGATLELTPAEAVFADGTSLRVFTTYRIQRGGKILIERRFEGSTEGITATEYFKGAPGRTEYPEDLHGIELSLTGAAGTDTLAFSYSSHRLQQDAPTILEARIPQTRTHLALTPGAGSLPVQGSVSDGHLFNPYFTLQLTYDLKTCTTIASCLTFKKLI